METLEPRVLLDAGAAPVRVDIVSGQILWDSTGGPYQPGQTIEIHATNPTAWWTARPLVEAFPFDTSPRFLLRDRDSIYGHDYCHQVKAMGIEEIIIAPRAPWQNPYVKRLIGSIRRECLDHVIVFGEDYLRRVMAKYFACYHEARAHLSPDRNSPIPRHVEAPESGRIVAESFLGGLHHRYRRAA